MRVATTSTEECRASEISARLPIAIPTTNLAAAMAPLANTEIAATRDLTVRSGWPMGAGLAALHATSKRGSDGQSPINCCSDCCELFRLKRARTLQRHHDLAEMS